MRVVTDEINTGREKGRMASVLGSSPQKNCEATDK